MPAAASSASFSWRCVVDGGWTIIVWMLPSDAVSAGHREGVEERPGRRSSPFELEGEHPAPTVELAGDDVGGGMAREQRVADLAHTILTLEPARECR